MRHLVSCCFVEFDVSFVSTCFSTVSAASASPAADPDSAPDMILVVLPLLHLRGAFTLSATLGERYARAGGSLGLAPSSRQHAGLGPAPAPLSADTPAFQGLHTVHQTTQ